MNQNIRTFFFLASGVLLLTAAIFNFKSDQKKFPRVKEAYTEKEKITTTQLAAKGIKTSEAVQLYILAFKEESMIELWAKNNNTKIFQLVDSFEVCSMSGNIGPKREQGDRQVPEGFYHIDRFNPSSNFHLSLGINYPNTSDKIRSKASNLGGNIFIHGSCVSIGCMAITDEQIKKLYIYCVEAYSGGQTKIPVTILPARLTTSNYNRLVKRMPEQKELWTELQSAYSIFNTTKKLPAISFLETGRHTVQRSEN
ncbi:MAG: L,D-transpeptidase family protein [Cytophagaceae bacterium]|nr:L,D-transpeptidase family protein [Cytophagaceae bacterium]